MKTNQFNKEIKSMGFQIKELYSEIVIKDGEGYIVAIASKVEFAVLVTDYRGFYRLDYNNKLKLLNRLIKYAKTPIEDREEEEMYYYKLIGFGEEGYLNSMEDGADIFLSDSDQFEGCQTQFTDKEFAALPDDIKSHNWEKIKIGVWRIMKIKLTIDFSPNYNYKIDDVVECYFDSKFEMRKFLKALNNASNKKYEYTWKEI